MDSEVRLSADEFSSTCDIQIALPNGVKVTISQHTSTINKRRRLIQEKDDSDPDISSRNLRSTQYTRTASHETRVSEAEEPDSQDWSRFYQLRKGQLPSIQTCKETHDSMRFLAEVPLREIPEGAAISGHFFSESNCDEPGAVFCRTVLSNGQECLKKHSLKTSFGVMLRHIMSKHTPIYDALSQFRDRQDSHKSAKLCQPSGKEASQLAVSNPPSESDQMTFQRHLMKLVTSKQLPMSTVESQEFKDMVRFLNPKYQVSMHDVSRVTHED